MSYNHLSLVIQTSQMTVFCDFRSSLIRVTDNHLIIQSLLKLGVKSLFNTRLFVCE